MGDKVAQGKRGMILERKIIKANEVYRMKGLGLINKVPTPWVVQYNRKTGRVFQAFPREKSTVDFEGVAFGKSIAFEAKSTDNKTSFPLKNVGEHQVQYLKDHQDHGGLSFMIVSFRKWNEDYFLSFDDLYFWWLTSKNGGRKSIPLKWFRDTCERILPSRGVICDYLKIIEVNLHGEEKNRKQDASSDR